MGYDTYIHSKPAHSRPDSVTKLPESKSQGRVQGRKVTSLTSTEGAASEGITAIRAPTLLQQALLVLFIVGQVADDNQDHLHNITSQNKPRKV